MLSSTAPVPLVALHGAGVDHREIEAAVEAVVPGTGYRRIYPDLPGMGRSTADGLTCNDDVVTLLGDVARRRSSPTRPVTVQPRLITPVVTAACAANSKPGSRREYDLAAVASR